jgi:hypothetical protein
MLEPQKEELMVGQCGPRDRGEHWRPATDSGYTCRGAIVSYDQDHWESSSMIGNISVSASKCDG